MSAMIGDAERIVARIRDLIRAAEQEALVPYVHIDDLRAALAEGFEVPTVYFDTDQDRDERAFVRAQFGAVES